MYSSKIEHSIFNFTNSIEKSIRTKQSKPFYSPHFGIRQYHQKPNYPPLEQQFIKRLPLKTVSAQRKKNKPPDFNQLSISHSRTGASLCACVCMYMPGLRDERLEERIAAIYIAALGSAAICIFNSSPGYRRIIHTFFAKFRDAAKCAVRQTRAIGECRR